MPHTTTLSLAFGATLAAIGATTVSARTATDAEIGALLSYAGILGRAAACNVDVQWPTRLVADWMDEKFPPGTDEQQHLLSAFINEMLTGAALQRRDARATSCAEIARTVQDFAWPVPGL